MKIDLDQLEKTLREREEALTRAEALHRENGTKLAAEREQLETDLRALLRTKELAASPTAEDSTRPLTERRSGESLPNSIRGWVVSACYKVATKKATFSSKDVVEFLKTLEGANQPTFDIQKNRSNISTYMGRALVDDRVLIMVARASGRRPATFRLRTGDSQLTLCA